MIQNPLHHKAKKGKGKAKNLVILVFFGRLLKNAYLWCVDANFKEKVVPRSMVQ
jgi:hypothetical protein